MDLPSIAIKHDNGISSMCGCFPHEFSRQDPKQCCKERDEEPGQILQVPFVNISVEDRAQDFLERFSVEAAEQDPCVRLSAQGVYRRSPQKIFVRDLKVRSL